MLNPPHLDPKVRTSIPSEPERVLGFDGKRSIGRMESRDDAVLDPSLVEDENHLASGTKDPPRSSLPPEIPGFVVELDQIKERQQR